MYVHQEYPKVVTSISLATVIVASEEEFNALGKDWYLSPEEAEKALEARTKPVAKKPEVKSDA